MSNDEQSLAKAGVSRRGFNVAGAALVLGAAGAGLIAQASDAAAQSTPNAFKPVPKPKQAPVKEGIAEIPGTKLWYWDTGGSGQTIVLMHPATGSGLIWTYQQPAFAAAGYRVIGYSRRGYYKSEPADKANGGQPSEDLKNLMSHLKVDRFHAVGSAAGCSVILDFAISYPGRLRSMVLSSGAFGTLGDKEKDYATMTRNTRVKGLAEMPPEFREVGAAYRAANPEGTKEWVELEHKAINGNRLGPTNKNDFTYAVLKTVKVPTLMLAGGSDLMAPSPLHRLMASHMPRAEVQVIPESGHSIYWEQPEAFNKAVLNFVRRNRA
jgi:pimeloyl-ACP methyl ester carboxylesterase